MLKILLQNMILLLLTVFKMAVLQMQENIQVENTCVSKLKELFPELKQLLGRGWEETSIIILPSTKTRCHRCIKQDIMYYEGISAKDSEFSWLCHAAL